MRPEADPAFGKVKGNVKEFATAKRAHPPAASKAKEAQDAALPPTDDVAGQAKAAKVDTMDAQQAGTFDKKAFIAAVKTAIEAKSPKTLKEADDYKESGKAGEVKGEVKGMVTQGKEGSAQGHRGGDRRAPRPVEGRAQGGHPAARRRVRGSRYRSRQRARCRSRSRPSRSTSRRASTRPTRR